MVQGYLFSRPLAADEIVKWLRTSSYTRTAEVTELRRVV
jgi:EAL domain-containing protein (putative c-di-GMP-specific phosphodiesterase class I)